MTDGNILEANFQEGSRKWQDNVVRGFILAQATLKGRTTFLFHWTLILFFFLLPLQTRYFFREALFYEYGTLSVFLVEALGWVVIVLGLVKIQEYRNIKLRLRGIFLYSGILVFLSFLSIAWAPDKTVALQGAVRLLEGVLLYLVISRVCHSERSEESPTHVGTSRMRAGSFTTFRMTEWWVYAFLAGVAIQAALGIYQFLTQSTLASTLLGMAFHDPVAAGTAVVEFGDQRWLRAYGGLPHPNVLGGYLVVALAVGYQKLQEVTGSYKKLPLLGMALVLLTGIFFSFSRAAWIAAIGLLGYWVIKSLVKYRHSEEPEATKNPVHKPTGSFAALRMTRIYVLLTTFYVLFLVLMFRPLVATRLNLQSPERLEIKARVERVLGVRESWELIKKHPVLGVGIGNYTQGVRRDVRSGDPLYTYQPAHSVPFLVWAELGAVGLIMWLAILWHVWQTVRHFDRAVRRVEKSHTAYSEEIPRLRFAPLGMTLGLLLLFDHYLWSLPFGIMLFWAVLGLFGRHPQETT